MSELRRDPITARWNIIDTTDPTGPDGFEVDTRQAGGTTCPFCAGQERLTPPEIYAVRPASGAPNGAEWQLRVIPNKFPALRIEGQLNRRGVGMFDLSNGVGAHEVIIETPDHHKQLADLTVPELERVVAAFRLRSLDLRNDPRLKYTLIFKNHGLAAGASLEHTHSQLIALPIVPKRVAEELKGASRYFDFRERCSFCDVLQQEYRDEVRLIGENKSMAAFCPFVSSFPFEIWILPKSHSADFAKISADMAADLSRMLKEVLGRLRATLSDPPYNFIIHTSPIESKEYDEYHWHVELIPKLTKVAGFEWGTGFYINPTPPELAAKWLREASVPA